MQNCADNFGMRTVNNKRKERGVQSQHAVCLLFPILLFLFSHFRGTFATLVRSVIENTRGLDSLFLWGLLALLVVYSLPSVRNSLRAADVFAFCIIACGFIFSWFAGKDRYGLFAEVVQDILFRCIPAYLLAISIRDYKYAASKMRYVAHVLVVIKLIDMIQSGAGGIFADTARTAFYSQFFGYVVLPAASILIASLFRRMNVVDALFLLVAVAMIFLSGARGPLLCVLGGVALMVVLKLRQNKKMAVLVIAGLLLVSVGLYAYWNQIIGGLLNFAQTIGFSTRSLNRIVDGTLLNDQWRNNASALAFDYITSNPIIGSGLLNDRIYLYETGQLAFTYAPRGAYPHNIFLEFMMQYGLVLGLALGIALLSMLWRSLFYFEDEDAIAVLFVTICTGFFPLLMSASYVNHQYFYAMMGVMVGMSRNLKTKPGMRWRWKPNVR